MTNIKPGDAYAKRGTKTDNVIYIIDAVEYPLVFFHSPQTGGFYRDTVIDFLNHYRRVKKPISHKVPVKHIYIRRAEGNSNEDPFVGKWQKFKTFAGADRRLLDISKTAPKSGGYDKTDVEVVWQNGDVYKGRWDVKHFSQPNPDISISKHIRHILREQAGDDDEYAKYAQRMLDLLRLRD